MEYRLLTAFESEHTWYKHDMKAEWIDSGQSQFPGLAGTLLWYKVANSHGEKQHTSASLNLQVFPVLGRNRYY